MHEFHECLRINQLQVLLVPVNYFTSRLKTGFTDLEFVSDDNYSSDECLTGIFSKQEFLSISNACWTETTNNDILYSLLSSESMFHE